MGIELESTDGRRIHYVVSSTRVVHERDTSVLEPTDGPTLTLVTCYPLDGRRPGGPLRYVIRARGLLSVTAPTDEDRTRPARQRETLASMLR